MLMVDWNLRSLAGAPGEQCKDSHESCMHYAANGDCDIDMDTKSRCPRSCGVCNVTVIRRQPPVSRYMPTTLNREPTTKPPATVIPSSHHKEQSQTSAAVHRNLASDQISTTVSQSTTSATVQTTAHPLTRPTPPTPPLSDKSISTTSATPVIRLKPQRTGRIIVNMFQKTVGKRVGPNRFAINQLNSILSKDGPRNEGRMANSSQSTGTIPSVYHVWLLHPLIE